MTCNNKLHYDTLHTMISISKSEQEYLSLVEVAEKLNLSRMTVYRYVRSKKLPAYQFGRDYRVHKDDLDAFISSLKV